LRHDGRPQSVRRGALSFSSLPGHCGVTNCASPRYDRRMTLDIAAFGLTLLLLILMG